MYVAVVPNRGSPPAILLRESYRDAGKTKNRTLANLSRWPAERIEQLRAVLRGDKLLPAGEAVEMVRALPDGHVVAALGAARRWAGGSRRLPAARPCARRAGHGAPPRARRRPAPPGAATSAGFGAGPDRRPPGRAGSHAADHPD